MLILTEKDVEKVMEENEQSRNSDEALCDILIDKGYMDINDKCYFYCAVNRHRRRIQSKGLRLPTDPDILRKRQRLQSVHRDIYKTTKKEAQEKAITKVLGTNYPKGRAI